MFCLSNRPTEIFYLAHNSLIAPPARTTSLIKINQHQSELVAAGCTFSSIKYCPLKRYPRHIRHQVVPEAFSEEYSCPSIMLMHPSGRLGITLMGCRLTLSAERRSDGSIETSIREFVQASPNGFGLLFLRLFLAKVGTVGGCYGYSRNWYGERASLVIRDYSFVFLLIASSVYAQ